MINPFSFGGNSFHAGQSVTVQCTVSEGDLPLTITWAFNGEPIQSSEEISTSKISKRVTVLAIDSVAAKHAGNYTCFAQNRIGKASYTTSLNVNGSFY